MRAKFSGPLMPRPPETMMSASATSSSPPAAAANSLTIARIDRLRPSSATTSPAPPTSSAAKTFGRSEMTCGDVPALSTVANALPEYTGRRATKTPPSSSRATTSARRRRRAGRQPSERGHAPSRLPKRRSPTGCKAPLPCTRPRRIPLRSTGRGCRHRRSRPSGRR